MSTIIQSIEKEQMRSIPRFQAGDRVRVHFQVIEGSRSRTQVFEGVVIKRQGSGARETFTVRKQSFGVGVERTFPVHSPKIDQLEVAGRGDVRRAKLYYLRDRVGKAARVAERRWGITDDVLATEEEAAPTDSEGTSQVEAEVEVTEVEGEESEGEDAAKGESEADAEAAGDTDADADADTDADADAGDEAAEPTSDAEPEADAGEGADEEAEQDAEGGAEEASGDAGEEQAGGPEGDSTEDEASKQGG